MIALVAPLMKRVLQVLGLVLIAAILGFACFNTPVGRGTTLRLVTAWNRAKLSPQDRRLLAIVAKPRALQAAAEVQQGLVVRERSGYRLMLPPEYILNPKTDAPGMSLFQRGANGADGAIGILRRPSGEYLRKLCSGDPAACFGLVDEWETQARNSGDYAYWRAVWGPKPPNMSVSESILSILKVIALPRLIGDAVDVYDVTVNRHQVFWIHSTWSKGDSMDMFYLFRIGDIDLEVGFMWPARAKPMTPEQMAGILTTLEPVTNGS